MAAITYCIGDANYDGAGVFILPIFALISSIAKLILASRLIMVLLDLFYVGCGAWFIDYLALFVLLSLLLASRGGTAKIVSEMQSQGHNSRPYTI